MSLNFFFFFKAREKIWSGILEWYEKAKTSESQSKVPHQVPCYVTAREGDPEMCVFFLFSFID